jgi:hypothetical protein
VAARSAEVNTLRAVACATMQSSYHFFLMRHRVWDAWSGRSGPGQCKSSPYAGLQRIEQIGRGPGRTSGKAFRPWPDGRVGGCRPSSRRRSGAGECIAANVGLHNGKQLAYTWAMFSK